ncbi:MAG: YfcE family phosphodiesterase [Thermoleophilia bacterium]
MLIGVISDTHFPRHGTRLPEACIEHLAGCDLVIHAGDHADLAALAALRALGRPVIAVHGNADEARVRDLLPAVQQLELPGLVLAVTHNGGPADGRLGRMRKRFPDAGGVVFGHSHIPLFERDDDGFFILNPGSPTDKRRQPNHTMALLRVGVGRVPDVEFIVLDHP